MHRPTPHAAPFSANMQRRESLTWWAFGSVLGYCRARGSATGTERRCIPFYCDHEASARVPNDGSVMWGTAGDVWLVLRCRCPPLLPHPPRAAVRNVELTSATRRLLARVQLDRTVSRCLQVLLTPSAPPRVEVRSMERRFLCQHLLVLISCARERSGPRTARADAAYYREDATISMYRHPMLHGDCSHAASGVCARRKDGLPVVAVVARPMLGPPPPLVHRRQSHTAPLCCGVKQQSQNVAQSRGSQRRRQRVRAAPGLLRPLPQASCQSGTR